MRKNFFATWYGVTAIGLIIGILAAFLQKMGNPGNMGICVACMERDIAGALGLHQVPIVQYMRPEIIGLSLGAFLSALFFKEFRPRSGSSPGIRFILGIFAMIGALVFLGCPWRACLRLAGGDWNAVTGFLGLFAGIFIGTRFLKNGYSLGKSQSTNNINGYVWPAIMIIAFMLLLIFPQIDGEGKSGILFYSVKGPGSSHAPIFISLLIALFIGILAQRSRFCTMGALRDFILFRHGHLLYGLLALIAGAFIVNIILGQFKPGFTGQPVAHSSHLWNFLGMCLSGLAFSLAGGCPGRQLFLAGEGDGDAMVFVIGMFFGAAISHNFNIASSPSGANIYGPVSTLIGIIFCLAVGFLTIRTQPKS